jgi:hypothetical protein
MTTLQLIGGIVLFVVIGTLSGITIYHRDKEAKRFLEYNKLSGRTKGDDAFELRKAKRRLLVGYSMFIIVSLIMILYCLFKLLQNISYF